MKGERGPWGSRGVRLKLGGLGLEGSTTSTNIILT